MKEGIMLARPKKEIDYDAVEKLSNIQCTQEEIANFLEVSVRTLQRDEEFCRREQYSLSDLRKA